MTTPPVGLSRRAPATIAAEPLDIRTRAPANKAAPTAAPAMDGFGSKNGAKLVDLGTPVENFAPSTGVDLGTHTVAFGPRGGTRLDATAEQAKLISEGKHQIWEVQGKRLDEPSQDVGMIESQSPYQPGQTHTLTKHVGQTLEDNIERLNKQKKIPAAGGFHDLESAQYAVDATIANPANQRYIAEFLADPGRSKDAILRVDIGKSVGTNTLRSDLNAGNPCLRPATTATVVLIKDDSFPEGYRVLTAYPEATRKPDVDANGDRM